MALYNRLRIVVLDGSVKVRDTVGAKERFDPLFRPLGAKYAGYQSHSKNGPKPAHFWLLDDPKEEVIADLLALSQTTPLYLSREYIGLNPIDLTLEGIIADVANVLSDEIMEEHRKDSRMMARCWSGVKVLEHLARKALEV